MATALCGRFPDEKLAEDIHQHIRDSQRNRRHKVLSTSQVFFQQTGSGVLQERGVKIVHVSEDDIAAASWNKSPGPSMRNRYHSKPKSWPRELNAIVNPRGTWPSPTVKTQFNSARSWQWLLAFWLGGFRRQGCAIGDSWLSLLCSAGMALKRMSDGYVCMALAVGRWAVMCCRMRPVKEDMWALQAVAGSLHWVFITDTKSYTLFKVEPVALAAHRPRLGRTLA